MGRRERGLRLCVLPSRPSGPLPTPQTLSRVSAVPARAGAGLSSVNRGQERRRGLQGRRAGAEVGLGQGEKAEERPGERGGGRGERRGEDRVEAGRGSGEGRGRGSQDAPEEREDSGGGEQRVLDCGGEAGGGRRGGTGAGTRQDLGWGAGGRGEGTAGGLGGAAVVASRS